MKNFNVKIKYFIDFIFSKFHQDKNAVYFESFNGQYNDNPKYISEALHELYPKIAIYWLITSESSLLELPFIPSYVHILRKKSIRYYLKKNTARVTVDNYFGDHISDYYESYMKFGINPRQFSISTWHGTPMKKLDFHSDKQVFATTDVMISGSKFNTKCLQNQIFKYNYDKRKIRFAEIGSPRNDILIKCSSEKKNEIRQKLGFNENESIVLYAPTYRSSVYESGLHQMQNMSISALIEALNIKFGLHDTKFVFRGHHEVASMLKEMFSKEFAFVEDGNKYDDMAEYLLIADILITDYSGSFFDFILTRKPVFLYALDAADYIKNPGLSIGLDELPINFSHSFQELIDNIEQFDFDNYFQGINEFMLKCGYCENGAASYEVAHMINAIINEQECPI